MLEAHPEYLADTTLPETVVWEYWKQYMAHTQDFFWIRSTDFQTFYYASDAYHKLLGPAYLNQNWFNLIHEDDRIRVIDALSSLSQEPIHGKMTTLQFRILCKHQQIKHIEECIIPLFDASLKHIGFAGMSHDVTDWLTQLEESSKFSRYFHYFAEKVRAVFWARDDSYHQQIYLSSGYEKIWERSRDLLYANPLSWVDTLHPEDLEKQTLRMKTEADDTSTIEYEKRYRILTPSNEVRWIKDTSFPIKDYAGRRIGFAGIAEDITKEVLHEKELNEAKQRAEVANQAKSDFLAMVSHELRTPLNAILGMSQILKRKSLTKEQEEYVDIIAEAGDNLVSLVSDILDFVKLEAGKLAFNLQMFDLRVHLSQIIHSLHHQADERDIALSLHYSDEIPRIVMADPNRIRQVIVNLLTNALKFTESGFVKLVMGYHLSDQVGEEGMFQFEVVDSGIGIPPDKLNRIFDRFNQIDSIYHRRHRGIGLGLAITKQLIETMGGSIVVQSEVGKGSRFLVNIPLKQSPDQMLDEPIKRTDSKTYAFNAKVLLIEDNFINQKIAKLMLEDLGCHVDILEDGEAVLQHLSTLSQYDIIFMDVGLPDMSGFDITIALRKIRALDQVPIVAMTAHILDRDRQQAFSAGMNRILAKPINFDELTDVLREYVGEE